MFMYQLLMITLFSKRIISVSLFFFITSKCLTFPMEKIKYQDAHWKVQWHLSPRRSLSEWELSMRRVVQLSCVNWDSDVGNHLSSLSLSSNCQLSPSAKTPERLSNASLLSIVTLTTSGLMNLSLIQRGIYFRPSHQRQKWVDLSKSKVDYI